MDSTELSEQLQVEIKQARQAAAIADLAEPRAKSACYDRETGRIVVNLQYGAVFSFPFELGQGLENAPAEALADVEVTPSDLGLHWETLDADLSVPALLNGIYGNSA